ncbi:MAG: hypothetical protein HN478_11535 [Rhodospirillaceae bacterium]|jgi:hypothetical protein|nr:hypothetical protein [Rhodospirillaceae bacterium]MBT4488678.1 hypothetical protein [Rhodospirillaceae bacterium]MBT5190998.1 hypothetical protein [Rhodospirillaceae bacterium]MBT5894519.1 hypothetical protein [Rhodospirillaceae bacterium]MBT6427978.1 hypothetical protein [Rhodospirillaceae bacterium]
MNGLKSIIAYYRRKRSVTLLWHHGLVFVVAIMIMVGARATFAPWMPLFWPLLIWYIVFSLHFLLVRSLTANDEWADERADKIRRHAYDFQHVKDIYIKPTNFKEPTYPLDDQDK